MPNFNCFAFCTGNFLKFQIQLFIPVGIKTIFGFQLNFQNRGQLIQWVLPKPNIFGLESRGQLIHRVSLYCGIYGSWPLFSPGNYITTLGFKINGGGEGTFIFP